MTKRVAIYCRVSTKEQAKSGFSLEQQEHFLRNYAKKNGFYVVKAYIEKGITGTDINRPALNELREDAKYNVFDAVLFLDSSRFSRNLKYSHVIEYELENLGIEIIEAKSSLDTSTPEGRFHANIQKSVDQFEVERYALKTVECLKRRMSRGYKVGRAPFGYKYIKSKTTGKGILVPDKDTKEKVKEIFEMFLEGKTKYRIAKIIGISPVVVNRILRNRTYLGEMKFNGKWIKAKHKPLIDKETFFKVQKKLRLKEGE
jgi:site-specific DNA recombinase